MRSRFLPLFGPLPICIGGIGIALAFPTAAFAQAAAPGQFALKLSGYANASGAEPASQADAGGGGLGETEVELTPQYRTASGTVFAARGVANVGTVRISVCGRA